MPIRSTLGRCRRRSSARVGVQLEHELNDARLRIPWDGHSPRSLTRCGKLFSLVAPPAGGLVEDAKDQLLLFLKGKSHGTSL